MSRFGTNISNNQNDTYDVSILDCENGFIEVATQDGLTSYYAARCAAQGLKVKLALEVRDGKRQ